ncbi:hypothetical protein BB561_004522 [Smittium simulii]|uniref:BCD1 alpha/beta domain-containing protein n=1 Tax=Smittium simulii TaxID=133385 RepID=A0A2T9YFS1_9FUNG|nr:hypothetical protein BB561_004522 [Smittium simulii]
MYKHQLNRSYFNISKKTICWSIRFTVSSSLSADISPIKPLDLLEHNVPGSFTILQLWTTYILGAGTTADPGHTINDFKSALTTQSLSRLSELLSASSLHSVLDSSMGIEAIVAQLEQIATFKLVDPFSSSAKSLLKLDPSLPLNSLLSGKQILEFPTISVHFNEHTPVACI